jgi:hypothetical protein
MTRKYNSAGDHVTWTPNVAAPSGYTNTFNFDNPIYGYPRYAGQGQAINQPKLTTQTNGLSSTTNGYVSVGSNAVAGGAVWTWTSRIGKTTVQYINDCDTGRQMQSAIFFADDTYPQPYPTRNPTEAGAGSDSTASVPNSGVHGSPLVTLSNDTADDGTGVLRPHQRSRCVPLEFWNGSYPDQPWWNGVDVSIQEWIYPSMQMGKDIYLNFNGWPTVTKYVTYLHLPTTLPSPAAGGSAGVYLRGNFTHFYVYDASTASLTAVVPDANGNFGGSAPNYGGVIAVDGAGGSNDHALGLYSVGAPGTGGMLAGYQGGNYSDGHSGQYDGSCTCFALADDGTVIQAAGDYYWTMWVITDTRQNVQTMMNNLYAGRAQPWSQNTLIHP